MTVIETEKETSPNSAEKLFNFLTDMNNFERLMPQDKIEKWSSDSESCEFTIKGMSRIGLKQKSTTPYSKIEIESYGKVPFPFTLEVFLKDIDENNCETSMTFTGEINAFMKLLVEKPLRNFFNMLVKEASNISL